MPLPRRSCSRLTGRRGRLPARQFLSTQCPELNGNRASRNCRSRLRQARRRKACAAGAFAVRSTPASRRRRGSNRSSIPSTPNARLARPTSAASAMRVGRFYRNPTTTLASQRQLGAAGVEPEADVRPRPRLTGRQASLRPHSKLPKRPQSDRSTANRSRPNRKGRGGSPKSPAASPPKTPVRQATRERDRIGLFMACSKMDGLG